ncbi:hypothetical protein HDV05_000471 [Chytridiales sp. JEL 0842]|nr:hypothetical protein HDV05_000471 [Chytridiales sp. JEL 0842]
MTPTTSISAEALAPSQPSTAAHQPKKSSSLFSWFRGLKDKWRVVTTGKRPSERHVAPEEAPSSVEEQGMLPTEVERVGREAEEVSAKTAEGSQNAVVDMIPRIEESDQVENVAEVADKPIEHMLSMSEERSAQDVVTPTVSLPGQIDDNEIHQDDADEKREEKPHISPEPCVDLIVDTPHSTDDSSVPVTTEKSDEEPHIDAEHDPDLDNYRPAAAMSSMPPTLPLSLPSLDVKPESEARQQSAKDAPPSLTNSGRSSSPVLTDAKSRMEAERELEKELEDKDEIPDLLDRNSGALSIEESPAFHPSEDLPPLLDASRSASPNLDEETERRALVVENDDELPALLDTSRSVSPASARDESKDEIAMPELMDDSSRASTPDISARPSRSRAPRNDDDLPPLIDASRSASPASLREVEMPELMDDSSRASTPDISARARNDDDLPPLIATSRSNSPDAGEAEDRRRASQESDDEDEDYSDEDGGANEDEDEDEVEAPLNDPFTEFMNRMRELVESEPIIDPSGQRGPQAASNQPHPNQGGHLPRPPPGIEMETIVMDFAIGVDDIPTGLRPPTAPGTRQDDEELFRHMFEHLTRSATGTPSASNRSSQPATGSASDTSTTASVPSDHAAARPAHSTSAPDASSTPITSETPHTSSSTSNRQGANRPQPVGAMFQFVVMTGPPGGPHGQGPTMIMSNMPLPGSVPITLNRNGRRASTAATGTTDASNVTLDSADQTTTATNNSATDDGSQATGAATDSATNESTTEGRPRSSRSRNSRRRNGGRNPELRDMMANLMGTLVARMLQDSMQGNGNNGQQGGGGSEGPGFTFRTLDGNAMGGGLGALAGLIMMMGLAGGGEGEGGDSYEALLRLAELVGPARPRNADRADVDIQLPVVIWTAAEAQSSNVGVDAEAEGKGKENAGGIPASMNTEDELTSDPMDVDHEPLHTAARADDHVVPPCSSSIAVESEGTAPSVPDQTAPMQVDSPSSAPSSQPVDEGPLVSPWGVRDLLASTKEKCTICLMPYDDGDELRIMRCKHGFHKDCIDQWLTGHVNSCPLCRSVGVRPTGGSSQQPEVPPRASPSATESAPSTSNRQPSPSAPALSSTAPQQTQRPVELADQAPQSYSARAQDEDDEDADDEAEDEEEEENVEEEDEEVRSAPPQQPPPTSPVFPADMLGFPFDLLGIPRPPNQQQRSRTSSAGRPGTTSRPSHNQTRRRHQRGPTVIPIPLNESTGAFPVPLPFPIPLQGMHFHPTTTTNANHPHVHPIVESAVPDGVAMMATMSFDFGEMEVSRERPTINGRPVQGPFRPPPSNLQDMVNSFIPDGDYQF